MGCSASKSTDASVPWADESQLTFVIHEKGCCDGGCVAAPRELGPCSENEFAMIKGMLRPGDNDDVILRIPAQYPHLSAVTTDQRFLPGRTGGPPARVRRAGASRRDAAPQATSSTSSSSPRSASSRRRRAR